MRFPASADAPLSFEPYAGQSTGRKVRAWARFLHTGEALGLPGQTVAAIAASGAALLVWTGLSLAWRRWRTWLAKPTPSAAETLRLGIVLGLVVLAAPR